MSGSTQKRRERLLGQIYEHGQMTVRELAESMAVSEATVRRDLRTLADEQALELVYGGATVPRVSDYSFRGKATRNAEAKRSIGHLAASLVPDGAHLFVDSGTTCFELAPHLRLKRGLSVIVNSVRLAAELSGTGDVGVIVIGGKYRHERMDAVGPMAMAALEQLRGYVAFFGADGLSREFGVTASDEDSAYLHRLAAKNARESVLLVDHTKFHAPSLFKIVDWDAISRVVTDRVPAEPWLAFFESRGIDLVMPAAPAAEAAG